MSTPSLPRRTFIAIATSIAVAFGAAACGNDSTLGSGAAPAGPTRTITDVEGTEVAVPENPERIVVLSEPTMDAVLALGIQPAGVIAGRGQSTVPPYLMEKAGDLPLLGSVSQLNMEAVGAVAPDLILVDGTSVNNNPDIMAALRTIAPTVYTGYAGGDWRANLRLVAEAVNQPEGAERIIDEYNQRVEEMRQHLGAYEDKTFSIVRWQGNSSALILKEQPSGMTLEDLGLKRPPNQDRRGRGHSEPVSAENIAEIDADYMFFGTLGGSSVGNPNAGGAVDAEAAVEAINNATTVAGFTDLKAYKDGNVIPVDGATWTSTGGPLLINTLLDDVQAALIDQ